MQTVSEMQKVLQLSPLSPIDEEKSLSSWMENVQIILNTESTLCLLFVCFYAPLYYLLLACMFLSYISLKFLTYNCLIFFFFQFVIILKKYLITYCICKCTYCICKCKDFKILKSVN